MIQGKIIHQHFYISNIYQRLYTNSNTVARKSFSFRSKTITNYVEMRNFFLSTVPEFLYVKTALVFKRTNAKFSFLPWLIGKDEKTGVLTCIPHPDYGEYANYGQNKGIPIVILYSYWSIDQAETFRFSLKLNFVKHRKISSQSDNR